MDGVKRITLRAHLATHSGYGGMICEIFHHLQRLGVFVTVRPTAIEEQWGATSAIPKQMRAQIMLAPQPEEYELYIGSPTQRFTPGKKTICFTMWETTELPPEYVSLLNLAHAVIVPCTYNAENFKRNGVNKPIYVVPLGVDRTVFIPHPMRMVGPTVFGVAGRTLHCAVRKGVQEAINLFLRTFPSDDSVRLHVKIHPDDKIADVKDSRIKVTREHFEPYQLAQWISNLTAFVSLAKGEGFGLWPLQALMCARPVIACKYSGHADFLPDQFAVPFKEIQAVSGEPELKFDGLWASPDEKVAAALMSTIHRHRNVAEHAGNDGFMAVKDFTWEHTGTELFDVLDKIGVWS